MEVPLHDVDVLVPKDVTEVLRLLSSRRGFKLLAGGTDLLVQLRSGAVPKSDLIDISGLRELRYVKRSNGHIAIGALTTFSEIAESEIVKRYAPILAEAAETIGSVQIMNKGTIGGNIINASPAADSLPPLYVLDAELKLISLNGTRIMGISDFYKGYKMLEIRPGELLAEVKLRAMGAGEVGHFFKHGLRQGDAISVVNGAVILDLDGDKVRNAAIALGAVAPTVVRAPEAEKVLKGKKLREDVMWEASRAVLKSISPIDDVRGSAAYRREMSVNYLYMTLWRLAKEVGAV
ncbi:MAG: FAD binding domain-containing protein [Thaumarchaeota archaeon]|nr:FAD binding domain-containing protein [Candidatus Calditenuaceae archaeon]MDW8187397.1 FAD binding domain-containing protein [Nitrososphaerota archaeon]